MPLTSLTPSVILSGAKIPICHPRAQRRILIGIFAKSKFCGVQLQCNETKQNRRRRDLRWVFSKSAQPLLHFFVDRRGRLSLHYVLCAGSVSETVCRSRSPRQDPSLRSRMTGGAFAVLPRFISQLTAKYPLCKTSTRSVALRPPLAQDDTRGGRCAAPMMTFEGNEKTPHK